MANLMLHCGALTTERGDLKKIPAPTPRGTKHTPVEHHVLVSALIAAIEARGWAISREAYGVTPNHMKLFGVYDLAATGDLASYARDGETPSIGFRHGNDCSMAAKLAGGSRVFVCDNLALSGDEILMCRKHTSGFDIDAEIGQALDNYPGVLKASFEVSDKAKEVKLTVTKAKVLICDIFANDILPPSKFLAVYRNYFKPDPEWTDITQHPNTLWAVHSAATREARRLKPERYYQATQRLGVMLKEAA